MNGSSVRRLGVYGTISLSRRHRFLIENENYDGAIDDNVRDHERLVLPRSDGLRWWHKFFGRIDAEMNGPTRPRRSHVPENGHEGGYRFYRR